MEDMQCFIYMIKPVRPGMIDDMTPEEELIIGRHFDYLIKALDEGKLVLAGPCLDGAFGIVLLKAMDEAQATDFMDKDPAVYNKVMNAELHPFKISLGVKDK